MRKEREKTCYLCRWVYLWSCICRISQQMWEQGMKEPSEQCRQVIYYSRRSRIICLFVIVVNSGCLLKPSAVTAEWSYHYRSCVCSDLAVKYFYVHPLVNNCLVFGAEQVVHSEFIAASSSRTEIYCSQQGSLGSSESESKRLETWGWSSTKSNMATDIVMWRVCILNILIKAERLCRLFVFTTTSRHTTKDCRS